MNAQITVENLRNMLSDIPDDSPVLFSVGEDSGFCGIELAQIIEVDDEFGICTTAFALIATPTFDDSVPYDKPLKITRIRSNKRSH